MKKIILSLWVLLQGNAFAQSAFIGHNPDLMKIKCPAKHIELSDLDNDGDKDLFSIDQYTGQFLIYKNSTGNLIDTSAIVIDGAFSDFVMIDWNNDNLPDVLTESGGGVSLLINAGSLGFQSPVLLAAGLGSGSLDIRMYLKQGDFNADGFMDFCFNAAPVKFYINQSGAASVTVQTSNITISNLYYDVTDIDQDGNLEIYEGQYSIEDVKVYESSGGYTFTYVSTIDLPAAYTDATEIIHADLNNDGIPELIIKDDFDLAVLQHTSGLAFASIYTGNFNYGVGTMVEFFSPIADVDNNGYKDIVIGNSVFNNSNLVFTENQITASATYAHPLFTVGDVDNNGMNELWWNYGEFLFSGLTRIYSKEYNGTGYNASVQRINFFPVLDKVGNKAIADFDGDGDIDIAYHSSRNMIICENTGGDNYVQHVSYGTSGVTVSRHFYCVDMNNDGLTDILDYDLCCSPVNIKYKKNLGGFAFQDMGTILSYGVTNNFLIRGNADFNGDGFQDLIVLADNGSTNVYVDYLQNNGGTGFAATQIIYTLGTASINSSNMVDIADADNDGMLDLLTVFENDFSTPTFRIAVLEYNGAGFTQHFVSNISSSASGARFIDLNADSLLDIVYRKSTNLTWHKNNGGGSYNAAATFQSNPGYTGGPALDINNDGLVDLAGTEAIFFDGTAFTSYPGANSFGGFNWQYVEDYDGDGDQDILNSSGLNYFENVSVSPYKILADVFYDNNTNGIEDAGDFSVPGFPVKINQLGTSGVTNAMGKVLIPAGGNMGTFALASTSPYNSYFTFTTPYPAAASLSAAAPLDTGVIGFYMTGGAAVLLDQTLSNHRCNEMGRLYINTHNISPLATNQTITVNLAANTSFDTSSIVPTSVTGGQVIFNVSNIDPFATEGIWIDLLLPPTSSMGDTMLFLANVQAFDGVTTLSDNDSLLVPVTCAYDPNDKNITINNYVMQGNNTYVFGSTVEYLVRFQNTGNDTAATVTIRDNLSSYFDFNTVQAISGSHDYSFTIDSTGLLTVNFANINLPDSSVNFLGSMGYIKFRVGIKSTTPANKKILNHARIYFDLNPPVFTNTYSFYTMSCKYLANPVRITPGSICANTTQEYLCNSYGLPVEYYWTYNGAFAGTDSLEGFFIAAIGTHSIYVSVDLPVCSYDTTVTFTTINSAVNLTVSAPDTSVICPGQSLSVSSNYPAQWFQAGTLSSGASYTYSAAAGYLYTASYTIGGCTATKNFFVDSVDASLNVTVNGLVPSASGISVCGTSALNLASGSPSTYWYILDDYLNEQEDTAAATVFPVNTSGGTYNVFAEAYFDTLGCSFYKGVNITVMESPLLVPYVSDSVICTLAGETAVIDYSALGSVDPDYLYISLDGVPYDTVPYSSGGVTYTVSVPGVYSVIGGNGGCLSNTVSNTIYAESASISSIVNAGDTLFTGDGLSYDWYYSATGTSYALLTFDYFIASPATGYYYYTNNAVPCTAFSDTLVLLTTGIDFEKQPDVKTWFDNAAIVISGNNLAAINLVEVYDYSGRLVLCSKPTDARIPFTAETGIYVLRVHTKTGVIVRRLFR